jgi:uncharacterized membrane protein
MELIASQWVLFVGYSMIGWLYESLLCSVQARKPVNRGFLTGPFCPIYGVGAMLVLLLLGAERNVFALFFSGMVICTAVEYVTSFGLEKLFHARWWDYSGHRFNINGRVCLLGAVVFGAMAVLLILFLNPAATSLIDTIPTPALLAVASLTLIVLATDAALTVSHLLAMNSRIKQLQSEIEDRLEARRERILSGFARFQHRRLSVAFPQLRHLRHSKAWDEFSHTHNHK